MFGGVGMQPQIDQACKKRRRHPGSHAGSPARPPSAAHGRPERRSRSSCSTKPTACSTWASSTTSRRCWPSLPAQEAEPALLGHVLRRDQGPGRSSLLNKPALIEVARRNQTAEHHRAEGAPGRPRQEEGNAHVHLDPEEQLASGAGLHAHEARCQPACRASDQERHQRDGHPWQQEPDRAHQGACRVQDRRTAGAGGHGHRSPRHRHRPVAPRRQFRIAQRVRKTTSTASAVPAVPAPRARPYLARLRRRRTASCATSSGSPRTRSRRRSSPASSHLRTSAPSRSCWAGW